MIRLEFPSSEHEKQVMELREDFLTNGDSMNGTAGLRGYTSFDKWLKSVILNNSEETVEEGLVPATTYLAIREQDDKLVGMIDIRHRLSEYLIQYGGHLGYCVLKSERQKGYAKLMVKLAINKSRELGQEKILVCCYKANISSVKTIISNGGILENEIIEEGELVQRYWIKC